MIAEYSSCSIISTDTEGFITSWNKGAESIFGYTLAEAFGQHISLIYHDIDFEKMNTDIIKPLISKGNHQTQVPLKHKNGESFIGFLSTWLIEDKTGKAAG